VAEQVRALINRMYEDREANHEVIYGLSRLCGVEEPPDFSEIKSAYMSVPTVCLAPAVGLTQPHLGSLSF
jgi:hypothetical protein